MTIFVGLCEGLNLSRIMIEKNELYPVFLKLTEFELLIIGGGKVGLEKLTFLLKSSPNANIRMVATYFLPETIELADKFGVSLVRANYSEDDLIGAQLVIAATNDAGLNRKIHADCKQRGVLVNVADYPDLCDFYMGGIVTKGNLKVAISTNGKSPTAAKRLRQFFEEVLPENIDDLIENLNRYRKTIKGDFQDKVSQLNELTKGLVDGKKK